MKLLTLITTTFSVTAIAFAGGSKQVMETPPPAPTLGGWFVGGTYGQLEAGSNGSELMNQYDPAGTAFAPGNLLAGGNPEEDMQVLRAPSGNTGDHFAVGDFDFDMYTLHVGRDLGTQVLGCDLAAYLEVGFLDGEATAYGRQTPASGLDTINLDLEIIPVTLNLKLERPLFAGINGYLTAGVGYAFTDASFGGVNETDGGFYAQASIGLLYNLNSQWEIFGGARWVHLSSLDFGSSSEFELDDDFAYEIGLRYNF